MNEAQLKDLIKSVISQISVEKEDDVIKAVEKCMAVNNCSDEEIVDITTDEYMKKILVPNPKDEKALRTFKDSTSARIGVWRAGDRPLTETILRFRADHALAVDSVFSSVDENLVKELNLVSLKTKVKDKDEHLTRPDLGRDLDEESYAALKTCEKNIQIQVIISDGLSSKAIEANIKDVLKAFMQGLAVHNIKVGTPVFVKYGRVGTMDVIGQELNAEAAIMFVGERPGLITAESMSAYMVYNPRRGLQESERTVVSNIHKGGTPPVEAGAHIATLMKRILEAKASGVNFDK